MQIEEPCFWTTLHGFTGDTLLRKYLEYRKESFITFLGPSVEHIKKEKAHLAIILHVLCRTEIFL